MDLRPRQTVFLNNIVGNVILEVGAAYEVNFPKDSWPELKTILRFVGQYANGYCFKILCQKHLAEFTQAHMDMNDNITYNRDDLRSAVFKRSKTLDVLYGSK